MATEFIPLPWSNQPVPLAGRSPALILAKEGIAGTCQRMADAWSRGDVTALSAVLAHDCDHITLTRVRHVKRGRAALVDGWQEEFARRTPDFSVRMTVAIQSIRLVKDDLALVDGALEYSAGIGAAGNMHGRSSQLFTAVMTGSELQWLMLSLRVGPDTCAAKVIPCSEGA